MSQQLQGNCNCRPVNIWLARMYVHSYADNKKEKETEAGIRKEDLKCVMGRLVRHQLSWQAINSRWDSYRIAKPALHLQPERASIGCYFCPARAPVLVNRNVTPCHQPSSVAVITPQKKLIQLLDGRAPASLIKAFSFCCSPYHPVVPWQKRKIKTCSSLESKMKAKLG